MLTVPPQVQLRDSLKFLSIIIHINFTRRFAIYFKTCNFEHCYSNLQCYGLSVRNCLTTMFFTTPYYCREAAIHRNRNKT